MIRLARAVKLILTSVVPWYDLHAEESENRRIDALVAASRRDRAAAVRDGYRQIDRRIWVRRSVDRP